MNALTIAQRVKLIDWHKVAKDLDGQGWSVITKMLAAEECDSISALYEAGEGFRSHVIMGRHGFGRGEYRYFSYPLPPLIQGMRETVYPHLVPLANRWYERMGKTIRFPTTHREFIDRCHDGGQLRPTALLLQYGPNDYNCLHQDLYGEQMFPLQLAVLLSQPGKDFDGGEFVMTEQRPRRQTRPAVVPLEKGDAAIFAVSNRPVQGVRGDYQVKLRHGVSCLRGGHRHALGVIFHDAA